MNMTRPFNPRALAIALASILTAPSALADTQFSAEMVQRGADGKSTTGQIAVGDGRLRTETVHQGQSLVRIGDEKRGVEWILFPERKNYMERSTLAPDGKAMAKPTAQDPCAGMPGVSCQPKGEEQVSGRAALVWEITATQMGKTMSTTQWIDKERGPSFPLRQTMAGGGKMERVALGEEVLVGDILPDGPRVAATRPPESQIEVELLLARHAPDQGRQQYLVRPVLDEQVDPHDSSHRSTHA